jgi:hypothetical protein
MADPSAGSASQIAFSRLPNECRTQSTTPPESIAIGGLLAAPGGNRNQHPGARPGGLRTRFGSWGFARQGWVEDSNTPPALRIARAGEMLATRITAISTVTIKTLIIRFIG